MRVLIADDDATTARILRALVEAEGHSAAVVADGSAALDALNAPDPPDVALIDWMMPEVNGPEVCLAVQQRAEAVPTYLILLTARDTPADVVAGLDAGADDYLVKPFDPDELRARMRAGARVRRLQQTLAAHVRRLEQALASVDQLSGLLPICAYCKSIRDDGDYWHRVEEYLADHSGVRFSHGICPTCVATLEKQGAFD